MKKKTGRSINFWNKIILPYFGILISCGMSVVLNQAFILVPIIPICVLIGVFDSDLNEVLKAKILSKAMSGIMKKSIR